MADQSMPDADNGKSAATQGESSEIIAGNVEENDVREMLIAAVRQGDAAIVKRIIDQTNIYNLKDEDKIVAYFEAAAEGKLNVVVELLNCGVDVNAQIGEYGGPALLWATVGNHVEVVRELLNRGADVYERDIDGWTALNSAIILELIEVVRVLLEYKGEELLQGEEGATSFIYAAGQQCVDFVLELLKHGADVNAKHSFDGDTGLMSAAESWCIDVVRELLKHGADINAQNNNGRTALMLAALYNNIEGVRELLNWGANVNIQSYTGWTALMIAALEGKAEIVRELVAHGADLGLKNNEGLTALMIASIKNNKDVVSILKATKHDLR